MVGGSYYKTRWNYSYVDEYTYKIKIKSGLLYRINWGYRKFKKMEYSNNYYRVHIPKLFGIIPLHHKRTTVVIAGDRTIYIIDSLNFKRLAKINDEEIQDLRNAGLIEW